MTATDPANSSADPRKFASRKVQQTFDRPLALLSDSLTDWMAAYLRLTVDGIRSAGVAQKVALHLQRFQAFFAQAYGHERLSTCVRRDVAAWQQRLQDEGLAPATVNNHLASLSAFTTWVHTQAPDLFPAGDPAKGIGELGLGPLEPRALDEDQIRSLKNLCDRLERFYQYKGRRRGAQSGATVRAQARPKRDRAIIYALLSTGLRREELIRLDLDQIIPNTPEGLRMARRAQILRVRGKGKTERTVFISADARAALADYLEQERSRDATPTTGALFKNAEKR